MPGRAEVALPAAPIAPDWSASTAFGYRRRRHPGKIEPVQHVATIRLAELNEADAQNAGLIAAGPPY